MHGTIETRRVELRFNAETGSLEGTAMQYGDVATLPWGKERFEAGAFGDSLGDVILVRDHRRDSPLARTEGGGLELVDTAQSLEVRAVLPDTGDARDTLELVRRKVLRGLSVGFVAIRERVEAGVRIVSQARIDHIAVVDRPAYPSAVIEARSAAVAALSTEARPLPRYYL